MSIGLTPSRGHSSRSTHDRSKDQKDQKELKKIQVCAQHKGGRKNGELTEDHQTGVPPAKAEEEE